MKYILLLILIIYLSFNSYTDIKSFKLYCFANYAFAFISILFCASYSMLHSINLFNGLLYYVIYSVKIFILFKIFRVGDGDTEMLICLFPALYFGLMTSGKPITLITSILYMQLLISLLLAFFVKYIKKIHSKIKNTNFDGKIALAPYISISTVILYVLILF